jgi:hypothetical protein
VRAIGLRPVNDAGFGRRLVLVAAIVAATWWPASSALALGAGNACTSGAITTALANSVFGHGAKVSYDASNKSCAITPPAGTDLHAGETIVELYSKSYFAAQVSNWLEELNAYGHASKIAVKGAGAGAVLLVATSYNSTQPLVEFTAGPYAILIESNLNGNGQSQGVYKQWEALARAMYAKLG